MNIDLGATGELTKLRPSFPSSLFDKLSEYGIGLPGQRIVDLGTGTGTLARGFAARGADVIGIDPIAALLAQAKQFSAADKFPVDYRVATAEKTGLPDASVDVVTAGHSWHLFDPLGAVLEVARILRVDGQIAIAHFDWIPIKGNVLTATEQLIKAHNPAWKTTDGTGVHPQCLRDLADGGFREIQTFSYDVFVLYSHEHWRQRIRATPGIGAGLTPEKVAVFDQELAALLADQYPTPMLQVQHRVWVAIAKSPLS